MAIVYLSHQQDGIKLTVTITVELEKKHRSWRIQAWLQPAKVFHNLFVIVRFGQLQWPDSAAI